VYLDFVKIEASRRKNLPGPSTSNEDMTAVMSPTRSPTSSPHQTQPSPNSNAPILPPLNTSYVARRTTSHRPHSYAKNRMSSYSTTSKLSETRSRPASYAFPAFHSSLTYTLVRDFAFPITHPWHYGPPPESSQPPSGNSTPASERQRRLSDLTNATWEGADPQWSVGPWGGDAFYSSQQLPQMAYGDGPPYSEDEDLHSPVVVSSRHKKHKSTFAATGSRNGRGRGRNLGHDAEEEDEHINREGRRSYFAGINGDGLESYYIGEEDESADGPGGELVTYPPDQGPHSLLAPSTYAKPEHGDSHYGAILPNQSYTEGEPAEDSDEDGSGEADPERDSRYSRDYQFTIASPDEEMHGKAVALYDFARENVNELPLTEGQVIWVSYRHGQGWLVAEDPRTGDTGLIPEEYVRLVRHIEGGLASIGGEQEESSAASPASTAAEPNITPTRAEGGKTHTPQNSSGSDGGTDNRPPVVSTFSTSSKDLKPYPHHILDEQARATPPPIVHYGSQSNTPTIASPSVAPHGLRNLEELKDDEEVSEGADEEEHETKAER